MRYAIALVLLLAACGPSWARHARPMSLPEASEVGRAKAAWLADGRPYARRCDEALGELQVAPMPLEEVPRACYAPNAEACLARGNTIAVRGDLEPPSYAWVIRHETLHVLHRCSGARFPHSDSWHQTQGLWEHVDGQRSTEWRARP